MSWDLYIEHPWCQHCGQQTSIASWNYTHNTNPMMRWAGCGPDDLDGLSVADADAKLSACIRKMEENPETLRAMNPENGWGDYDRLLVVLKEIRSALRCAPSTTVVRVSM